MNLCGKRHPGYRILAGSEPKQVAISRLTYQEPRLRLSLWFDTRERGLELCRSWLEVGRRDRRAWPIPAAKQSVILARIRHHVLRHLGWRGLRIVDDRKAAARSRAERERRRHG